MAEKVIQEIQVVRGNPSKRELSALAEVFTQIITEEYERRSQEADRWGRVSEQFEPRPTFNPGAFGGRRYF